MKKVIAFIPAGGEENTKYANWLINSIRKFHSAEEIPIIIRDNPNPKDNSFWYRATPIIANELLKEYETVIKMDADMICFGKLDHIINGTYDIGTVLNINRIDPRTYGLVTIQGVQPNEYYNNGLVALRNKEMVQKWLNLCHSKYFDRFQYREQDFLNILAHFGDYNVKCFDSDASNPSFNGLVAKGETVNAVLKDGQVVIPKGKDNYPDRDTVLKVWHNGGGAGEKKMQYRIHFSEEIIKYINWLISDSKEPYKEVSK